MLELINIHKNFGPLRALDGVNLVAREGSIHGLIGENGAGKSTLMKVLTGFLRGSSGEIRLRGNHVHPAGPRDALSLGIGMLYQEPLDFPQLSVLDNFIAGQQTFAPGAAHRRLLTLADDFGFHLSPHLPVGELTIGERQQLELLRLIDSGARVLILDEPTTGISEEQQNLLFSALHVLKAKGATILLVSHKLEEIEALCDAVTVLRHGRVAAQRVRPFDRDDMLRAMFDTLPEQAGKLPMTDAGTPLLTVQQVWAGSGRAALRNISLAIGSGEIVGLSGIEGSGQATFLKLACGLMPPSSGEINLLGSVRTSRSATALQPGTIFLPADRLAEGLFPSLTLREHHLLATPGKALLNGAAGLSETKRAIDLHAIKGEPHHRVEELSGGNQQRLLLSLIPPETRLVLMENPTRGLDVQSAAATWDLLRRLAEKGAAIIFASADLEEMMAQAGRILVFYNGAMVLDTPSSAASYRQLSRAITGQVDSQASP
jgi:general nucleoside transport system ATP-binding protein